MSPDKSEILSSTSGGLDFYRFVIPGLVISGHKSRPVRNPFYDDHKASLSLHFVDGQWLFNDFGDPLYKGDVFAFAGFYYRLDPKTDFTAILDNICRDLSLSWYPVQVNPFQSMNTTLQTENSHQPPLAMNPLEEKHLLLRDHFLDFELSWWSKYGITETTLQKFSVFPVDSYDPYPGKQVKSNPSHLIFAYKVNEVSCKIYQPLDKKHKFLWIGSRPDNWYFGYDQLPASGESLLITGGEKDVLSLHQHGLNAITLNSETATLSPEFYAHLASRFSQVVILYDNDQTGLRHSEILCRQYNLERCLLPPWLHEKGGKDISDYFALGGDINNNDITSERFTTSTTPPRLQENVFGVEVTPPRLQERGLGGEVSPLPFPVHIFPPSISTFISCASSSLNGPPDFVAVPILSVIAAAIGTSRSILLKSGFIEGPRLYSALIAEPGGSKSPSLKKATLPITLRQKELNNQYRAEKEEYSRDAIQFSIKLDAWKRTKPQERNADDHPSEPQPPVMGQVKTSDATMEAISKLLENNPRGILFEQDELAGWVKSMNAYRSGKGADLENWLSLWSGEQIIINRKSNPEPTIIFNPCVNVIGGIQPELLEDLSGVKQNGFFDRIIFSYPDPWPSVYTEVELPDHLVNAYVDVINRLFTLEHGFDSYDHETPLLLRFNQPAARAWLEWNKQHDAEMNDPFLPYYFKGPWAKFRSYMGRFILILQLAWNAENNRQDHLIVYPENVERAALLVDYFKSHARKTYLTLFSSNMDKKVTTAITWLKLQGGTASMRSMQVNKVAGCRSASQVRELIEELVERNLGTLNKSGQATQGRPSYIFTISNSTKS